MNIYKEILRQNIPRLLNLYNFDKFASTYGIGDRSYWGWKTSDFPNGTMQGGLHALAIALKLGLIQLSSFSRDVIDGVIHAIAKIHSKKNGLAEAYPNENSYCVTALVAFDALAAVYYLENIIEEGPKETYLRIIEPLIKYLVTSKEIHAVISNHQATAAAAICLWNKLTQTHVQKQNEILSFIYQHQSEEGWYREYEGADPGYQTLCTHYLSYIYQFTKDQWLEQSLSRSAAFLKFFIHPDGTIGGLYGSRNTEIYYPGGIVSLSGINQDFAIVASHLEQGIRNGVHVLPQDIDIGNFIPLLNSYAYAAVNYENAGSRVNDLSSLCKFHENFETDFSDAGIFIKSTPRYYAIINYKKGGAIKVFDKSTDLLDCEDGGLFGILKNGKKFSSQFYDQGRTFHNNEIAASFYMINDSNLTPLINILIRMMSITVFYFAPLNELFKKFIVRRLVTNKNKIDGSAMRRFHFMEDQIMIQEAISPPKQTGFIKHFGKATSYHMASSGYNLKQMQEAPSKPVIVQFQ